MAGCVINVAGVACFSCGFSGFIFMEYANHRLTIRSEKFRSLFFGPFIALNSAQFLVYIALEYFNASDFNKSLIAAAAGIGMLLNPVILEVLKRLRFPVSKAIAYTVFAAVLCFTPAVIFHTFSVYMPCVIAGVILLAILPTMITAMWRNNVAPEYRGKYFSQVCLIGSVSALSYGGMVALFMSESSYTKYYYLVLLTVAICLVAAGFFVWRIPGRPPQQPKKIPFSSLKLLFSDKLFAYICFAWFFIGTGNLSTIPIRVEYMASDKYGLNYSPWMVLLIMQIIPQAFRLGSNMIWGRIFDRMNLMHVRLLINAFFFLSIMLFFLPYLACQVIGAICFGLANGGGEIIWNLWVTKIAPVEKTGDYMSVHVFLCGIRAVFGPMLAYYIMSNYELDYVVYGAAGSIAFSCILFLPLLRHPRIIRKKP